HASTSRPVLPPDVPQYFAPAGAAPQVHYVPRLLAAGEVDYADRKLRLDFTDTVTVSCPIGSGPVPVVWDEGELTALDLTSIETSPRDGASFGPLPAPAHKARQYATWTKEFTRWLQQRELSLDRDPATGVASRPGEPPREFRLRVELAQRERRDAEKERIRQKFAPRLAKIDDQIRRAEASVAREQQQASAQKAQVGVSVVQGIFGALLGRKKLSATTIGRAGTAYRHYERSKEQAQDVVQATARVETLAAERTALEQELEASLGAIEQNLVVPSQFETVTLKPRRGGVHVKLVALVWEPVPGAGPVA
ncbi:MAG: hypothetical protein KJ061_11150, partial [Vicinamibacteraceae bacterium]|nr:hypothetical protein [Vicinamibacteraceae bacterium]